MPEVNMRGTCRSCVHRIRNSSGKGNAMYCDILHSRRTRNGHLRVKCNQPCCEFYRYSANTFKMPYADNQLSMQFD